MLTPVMETHAFQLQVKHSHPRLFVPCRAWQMLPWPSANALTHFEASVMPAGRLLTSQRPGALSTRRTAQRGTTGAPLASAARSMAVVSRPPPSGARVVAFCSTYPSCTAATAQHTHRSVSHQVKSGVLVANRVIART